MPVAYLMPHHSKLQDKDWSLKTKFQIDSLVAKPGTIFWGPLWCLCDVILYIKLFPLIVETTLSGRFFFFSNFTVEETKADWG